MVALRQPLKKQLYDLNYNDRALSIATAALYTDQGEQLYGDFNRDGDIDYDDLHLFTEDWLKTTTWHE